MEAGDDECPVDIRAVSSPAEFDILVYSALSEAAPFKGNGNVRQHPECSASDCVCG